MKQTDPPRKPGRPPLPMPDQIPDSLENVLKALVESPPVKDGDWEYQEKASIVRNGR